MGITIGSNIASLNAQRQLGKSTDKLSSIYERLSSGQRINKASDDAAGLAISDSLKADTRVFTVAIRNVNDGLSLLNVAQGALTQLSTIATRQLELAEQSANGTYSLTQRKAIQTESDALTREYKRIVESTEFNDLKLVDGSMIQGLRIQAGYGTDGSLSLALGDKLARYVGTGQFTQVGATQGAGGFHLAGDFNGDGKQDSAWWFNGVMRLNAGNGDGTFRTGSFAASSISDAAPIARVGDINGDGIDDFIQIGTTSRQANIYLGGASGFTLSMTLSSASIPANISGAAVSDVNGDGRADLVLASNTGYFTYLANSNGTFTAPSTITTSTTYNAGYPGINAGDFDGDGKVDIISSGSSSSGNNIIFLKGNGDGTFSVAKSQLLNFFAVAPSYTPQYDLNRDGILDLVYNSGGGSNNVFLGNGDGSFRAPSTLGAGDFHGPVLLGDVNGDGYIDFVSDEFGSGNPTKVYLGNGDGTFKAKITSAVPGVATALADFNGDGVLDLLKGGFTVLGNTSRDSSIGFSYLLTQQGSREALGYYRDTLDRINQELGLIGSFQSRLSVASNVLDVSKENYSSANSRILDADIAEESSELINSKITQQVAASVLAQANLQPQLALKLLQ